MIGKHVAHYRVEEKLGEGGMGEVYRARDTKLNRDVALKILPQVFALDSERMARFEREAQVLASLNHANIAQIYGIESVPGTGPAVDGRQSTVSRLQSPVSGLSHSPTLTQQSTQAGVILGTAAYMSPEQTRGRPVDKRADIWAFGCVLYEMLAGRKAFGGDLSDDTVSDVLASVLTREPGKRSRLIEGTFYAQYVKSGHLVFARMGTLFAVPFDLDRLEVGGPEVPVLPDVQVDTSTGRIPLFSVARNGTLVFLRSGQGFGNRSLRWVGRDGRIEEVSGLEEAVVGGRRTQNDLDLGDPRLSPDGRKLALTDRVGHTRQIGLFDLSRRVYEAMTSEGTWNSTPVWSSDGSQIAHVSNQSGQYNAFLLDVQERTGRQLAKSHNIQWPMTWSPRGAFLLIGDRAKDDQQDVLLFPVNDQESAPMPILDSESYESNAVISPDGQYVAFVAADQAGQPEVFVTAFTGEGALRGSRTKVSRAGGREPVWSHDSRELFFLSLDGDALKSVLIRRGAGLEVTEEQTLVNDLDLPSHDWMATGTSYYDVDPTGEKFLMVYAKRAPEIMELTVVLNWLEELKRLVPTE